MEKLKVLVVDDSIVVRRLITDVINDDPSLECVGTANNGKMGVEMFEKLSPDAVTLDIEMPVMDGISALVEIRKRNPRVPVIMFSTLTERGGTATLEALSKGASDYVTKPSNNVSGIEAGKAAVKAELVPRIKALVERYHQRQTNRPGATGQRIAPTAALRFGAPAQASAGFVPSNRSLTPIDIIAIGVSTGGPNALNDLVPNIPGDLPIPIVLVQHMPPLFTKLLADRLNTKSGLDIQEAHDGAIIRPGSMWIAPGDYHLEVIKHGAEAIAKLNQRQPENSCRPAVDVLFRSVVEQFGSRTLGVVLTGMGQDGMLGADAIKKAGGHVIVQDEATSVVWGMPGAVVHNNTADAILPLDNMGYEISKRARAGRVNAGRGA